VKEILAPYWEFSAEQIPIEGIELFAMFAGGELRLRLYPDRVFKSEKFRLENRTLFGPMASGAVDDVTPIKNAVRYKRKQVRASKSPVVLALHGGNMGAGLEDFDQALIGHSFEKIALVGDTTHRLGVGFTPDGELYRRLGSDKPPIYAGVLALRDVGFFGFKPPVFYPHPRFRGDLPEAITKLSSRILNFDTQEVEQRQAADEDEAMERMGFASHSV
jgi:hypothetical protein